MTDLPQRTPYELPGDPQTTDGQRETWASYQRALQQMGSGPDGISRLSAHLTEVSALIQQEARSTISQELLAWTSQQDRPVTRSTARADPSRASSPDRSASRPSSPVPSALDLLAARQRMGPRLAAKLVLSEARRQQRQSR